MRRFLAVLAAAVLIPYGTTLAVTGKVEQEGAWVAAGQASGTGEEAEAYAKADAEAEAEARADAVAGTETDAAEADWGRTVLVEREGKEIPVPAEEFLLSVLAAQIGPECGDETLKAQAVLARTCLYREMGEEREIREEALDLDAWSLAQMEKNWGKEQFRTVYMRLNRALRETEGETVLYDGAQIEPFFCTAAAGRTRTLGDGYPYLKQAESPGDAEAEGFSREFLFTPAQFAERINGIPGSVSVQREDFPEKLQIAARDGSGYVTKVQAGGRMYSGEEIQYALGLPSACFSFDTTGGSIRVITKGIGDGYGFSQAGANARERDGADYRELLEAYFQNITIEKTDG